MTGVRDGRIALVAAALVVVLLAGQFAAASLAPSGGRAETGRVLGRTGFAFLGGMRTFAAAVLWNRLDPVFHEYYNGTPLSEQMFALPVMHLVITLDPQFIQAYYIASFTLVQRGEVEQGIELAREGLENNPKSGLMHANLAQLLAVQDPKGNLDQMLDLANDGLAPDTNWGSADDMYEGLVIFRSVYRLAGDALNEQRVSDAALAIQKSGKLADDHDHDGDGEPDH